MLHFQGDVCELGTLNSTTLSTRHTQDRTSALSSYGLSVCACLFPHQSSISSFPRRVSISPYSRSIWWRRGAGFHSPGLLGRCGGPGSVLGSREPKVSVLRRHLFLSHGGDPRSHGSGLEGAELVTWLRNVGKAWGHREAQMGST